MAQSPEEPNDPREDGSTGGDAGAGRKLDEDAAWREIVENYGERPSDLDDEPPLTDPSVEPAVDPPASSTPPAASGPGGSSPPPPAPTDRPESESDQRLRGLFQPRWSEPQETPASWDDEGHFVPPNPPPVVVQDPRRRAAWMGLFGSPLLMLVAVVLGLDLPKPFMLLLTGAFVGGFVYLVATMPNRRSDGTGDDGAVV